MLPAREIPKLGKLLLVSATEHLMFVAKSAVAVIASSAAAGGAGGPVEARTTWGTLWGAMFGEAREAPAAAPAEINPTAKNASGL